MITQALNTLRTTLIFLAGTVLVACASQPTPKSEMSTPPPLAATSPAELEPVETVPAEVLPADPWIFFNIDSDEIHQAEQIKLDYLARHLKAYDISEVQLAGHADSTGPETYNLALSTRRARNVLRYLRSHGLTDLNVTVMPYGESAPVAENTSHLGRKLNRRVEIQVKAPDTAYPSPIATNVH